MLFNNFAVTQTSDDMPTMYAVDLNLRRAGTPGTETTLQDTACDSTAGGLGGVLRPNRMDAFHIDYSRLHQSIKDNGFPHLTHSDWDENLKGHHSGQQVKRVHDHIWKGNHSCPPSTTAPSKTVWVFEDDGNQGFPTCAQQPINYAGNNMFDKEDEPWLMKKPLLVSKNSGNATDSTVAKIYDFSDATGNINAAYTGALFNNNTTMFFVYHPFVNSDASGFGYPTGSSGTGQRLHFLGYENTTKLELNQDGVKFVTNMNGAANVDIPLDEETNINGLIQGRWSPFEYLEGAKSNGVGQITKEPIIWCCTYLGNQAAIVANNPHYTTFNHVGSPLYNDTAFWMDEPVLYRTAFPTVPKKWFIENQYGVLVGNGGNQTGGVGTQKLTYKAIGWDMNTTSSLNSLHGYWCEILATGQPISQKKRLHILAHLRRKWGISESYASGKIHHNVDNP